MSKLNVILDIDETFLYYINKDFFPHSWDTLSDTEKAKYKIIESKNGIFLVRPHLEEFCDYIFENFNVSLWTWSEPSYARGLPSKLLLDKNPERKLAYVFASMHAAASSKKDGVSKDLNYLWYRIGKEGIKTANPKANPNDDMVLPNGDEGKGKSYGLPNFHECNTILIDDLPSNSVNGSNKLNSITIKPFAPFGENKERKDKYHDVSNDRTLLEVLKILKKAQKIADKSYKSYEETEDEKELAKSVFSEENVEEYGLSKYMKKINIVNKHTGEVIETSNGIAAGDSHPFFVKGGKSKTRKAHRKSKTTRKAQRKSTTRRMFRKYKRV